MMSSDTMKVPNGQSGQELVLKVTVSFKVVFPQTTQKIVPGPGQYTGQ
jgi:hypothetical protein